jgi:hypothetical protein
MRAFLLELGLSATFEAWNVQRLRMALERRERINR